MGSIPGEVLGVVEDGQGPGNKARADTSGMPLTNQTSILVLTIGVGEDVAVGGLVAPVAMASGEVLKEAQEAPIKVKQVIAH